MKFLEKYIEKIDCIIRERLIEFAKIHVDFLIDPNYNQFPERLEKVLKMNNSAVINFVRTNCRCYRQLDSPKEYFMFYLKTRREFMKVI